MVLELELRIKILPIIKNVHTTTKKMVLETENPRILACVISEIRKVVAYFWFLRIEKVCYSTQLATFSQINLEKISGFISYIRHSIIMVKYIIDMLKNGSTKYDKIYKTPILVFLYAKICFFNLFGYYIVLIVYI